MLSIETEDRRMAGIPEETAPRLWLGKIVFLFDLCIELNVTFS